jgi:hypothetical protein
VPWSSHAPIPLTGSIRYVYDELRNGGASALDAVGIIKGLIVGGVGLTGVHMGPDYSMQAGNLQKAVRRQRAAAALRSR